MTPVVDAGRLTAVVLESATRVTGLPAATWQVSLTQLLKTAVAEGETRFAALSRIWETTIGGANPLRQVVLTPTPAHEPASADPLAEPAPDASPHDVVTDTDTPAAAWPAYFLRYGTLPTATTTLRWDELEAWIQAYPAQALLAIRAGAAYPDLMERILETLPEQVRHTLLAVLVPAQGTLWQDWGRHLGLVLGTPSRVWAHLVQYLADPQHPQHTPQPARWVQQFFRQEGQRRRQPVSELIRQVTDHPGVPAALALHLSQVQARMTETEARRQPTGPQSVPEMIAVHNAGLVLLWPFLPHLFQKLGMLTPKRKFVSSEVQARAVMLSQYLATGKTQSAEYLLYLNKLVCAFPMQEYLPVSIEVTDAEETLVTQLYQAVSAQWPAAKNSTMEGLRNSFILRDGKLLQKNGNWHLQVQSRGVDALLASLPWGLQTIRLSWMETPLLVEWKSQQIR
jgi:hypothetical protein